MSRKDRVKALKDAAAQYFKEEKTRLENEHSVLDAILKGRTAGAGIQKVSVKVVKEVADKDLAAYLEGA